MLLVILCQYILASIWDGCSFRIICHFIFNFTLNSFHIPQFRFSFFLNFPFIHVFMSSLFCRELMSQTRERRRRRVWGRRTPPRGRPIPRHPAVRSRKSLSNQLRTCRTHLTLSTCAHRPSRHTVTYRTFLQ